MKTYSLTLLAFFLFGIASSFAEQNECRFQIEDVEGRHLNILYNDEPLLRYMYEYDDSTPERRLETYKPYYHVFSLDRVLLTKGPGGLYPHHRGISIGWNKTRFQENTYDFWHLKNVNQIHRSFIEQTTGPDFAMVTSLIHWVSPESVVVVKEARTVRLHQPDEDNTYIVDVTSTLTAPSSDIYLGGDPEHAGVQFRPHNEVAERASEIAREKKEGTMTDIQKLATRYLFPDEGTDPKKDFDLPWVTAFFVRDSNPYSVTQLNHPSNPGPVIFSAYRDYGRFGAFFEKALDKGESFTTQFRFIIQEGSLPERETVQGLYEEYVR